MKEKTQINTKKLFIMVQVMLQIAVLGPNICMSAYVKLIRICNLKRAGHFRPMPPFLDPKSVLNKARDPIICVFFAL